MPIARMLLAAVTASQMELVGYVTGAIGTSLLLIGLDLQQGDLVYAWSVVDNTNSSARPSASSGWTLDMGGVYDSACNTYGVFKVMGATPDTQVTLKSQSTYGVMMAVAFRGARSSSPIIDTSRADHGVNPPSLSAGTATALSLCIQVGCGGSASLTPPDGWVWIGSRSNTQGVDSYTGASYSFPVTGTVNPPAFEGSYSLTDGSAIHTLIEAA